MKAGTMLWIFLICFIISEMSHMKFSSGPTAAPQLTDIGAGVCHDSRHNVVDIQVIEDMRKNSGDIARSVTAVSGLPTILLDSMLLSSFSPESVGFVFNHECAHHSLGHINDVDYYGRSFESRRLAELDADCYAVNAFMKDRTVEDLKRTIKELSALRQSTEREEHFMGCISEENTK